MSASLTSARSSPALRTRRNNVSASRPARTAVAVSSAVGVNVPASRCASAWLRPSSTSCRQSTYAVQGSASEASADSSDAAYLVRPSSASARRRCSLLG